MVSIAMIAPSSLLSCRKATVISEGISFDGSASADSMASVSVGDAILRFLCGETCFRAMYQWVCPVLICGYETVVLGNSAVKRSSHGLHAMIVVSAQGGDGTIEHHRATTVAK